MAREKRNVWHCAHHYPIEVTSTVGARKRARCLGCGAPGEGGDGGGDAGTEGRGALQRKAWRLTLLCLYSPEECVEGALGLLGEGSSSDYAERRIQGLSLHITKPILGTEERGGWTRSPPASVERYGTWLPTASHVPIRVGHPRRDHDG
jgi:hypothetical protein